MSRGRGGKSYDDDDMYDYYDDDDNYSDEYYTNEAEDYSVAAVDAINDAKDDNIDYVSFVMESLGKITVNSSGVKEVAGVAGANENRVLQMLEGYDYDVEKTLKYFSSKKTTAPIAAKQSTPIKAVSLSSAAATTVTSNAKKPATKTSIATATITSSSSAGVFSKSVATAGGDSKDSKAHTNTSNLNYTSVITRTDPIETDSNFKSKRPHITMIVSGHVDAGKSTLIGHLLHSLGDVSQKAMHKYQKESKEVGKPSFAFAWIMDQNHSERERGVTIDISEKHFKTKSKDITIVDSPGHRDFIPNMIAGAVQADIGLLVIPAAVGEYESATSINAQTREHSLLLKSQGITSLIVVVNKMDATIPAWSSSRYNQIVSDMSAMLIDLKYDVSNKVVFVPVSGYTGENLIKRPDDCELLSWYNGCTLIDVIDNCIVPTRDAMSKPVRAMITCILAENTKGIDASIAMIQGCLKVGDKVAINSSISSIATVKKILASDGSTALNVIYAGDRAEVSLIDTADKSGEEMNVVEGCIISRGTTVASMHSVLKATIVTVSNLSQPILPGSIYLMYIHGVEVLCNITTIYSMSKWDNNGGDASSTTTIARYPKCVGSNRISQVKLTVHTPIVIEAYTDCKKLSRFVIRDNGKTVAVGICRSTLN